MLDISNGLTEEILQQGEANESIRSFTVAKFLHSDADAAASSAGACAAYVVCASTSVKTTV